MNLVLVLEQVLWTLICITILHYLKIEQWPLESVY